MLPSVRATIPPVRQLQIRYRVGRPRPPSGLIRTSCGRRLVPYGARRAWSWSGPDPPFRVTQCVSWGRSVNKEGIYDELAGSLPAHLVPDPLPRKAFEQHKRRCCPYRCHPSQPNSSSKLKQNAPFVRPGRLRGARIARLCHSRGPERSGVRALQKTEGNRGLRECLRPATRQIVELDQHI